MTETIQNPLSVDQNRRAAAVSLAAEVTKNRSVSTDDVLDLAEFIVGPEPCPLAGMRDPIFFDIDLGTVAHEALELLTGTAPAEPEVITVAGVEGLDSLPVGSVVNPNGVGSYIKVGPNHWTLVSWLQTLGALTTIPTRNVAVSSGNIVAEFIPGGA